MDGYAPPSPCIRIGGRNVLRIFISTEIIQEKVIRLVGGRKNRDRPAHGAVSKDAGGRAAINLYILNVVRVNPVPVHPAAEGIIERDAIPQDERAAGSR